MKRATGEPAMRLCAVLPPLEGSDFERMEELGEHRTAESADDALATLREAWWEASLETFDAASCRWRVAMRRFPTTPWATARRWPRNPSRDDPEAYDVDADSIAAWLRAMGVRVDWDEVIARPWPGHELGELQAGAQLPPDRDLRVSRSKRRDPLVSIVETIIAEGVEYGGILARLKRPDPAIDIEGHRICDARSPHKSGTPAPQPCWFPNDADATVCRKCGARLA